MWIFVGGIAVGLVLGILFSSRAFYTSGFLHGLNDGVDWALISACSPGMLELEEVVKIKSEFASHPTSFWIAYGRAKNADELRRVIAAETSTRIFGKSKQQKGK